MQYTAGRQLCSTLAARFKIKICNRGFALKKVYSEETPKKLPIVLYPTITRLTNWARRQQKFVFSDHI